MRILFLTHAFNSLAQRLWCELTARGHEISIEFDINDAVAVEAVALWQPDLVIAPYLRRAIPASIWRRQVCLVVHPGIVGDRGPSALDWAIMNGETEWGVTLLQANAELDAGDIWAARTFALRAGATKASVYRNEVSDAALACVHEALERWPEYRSGAWRPTPLAQVLVSALAAWPGARGEARPLITQAQRAIDWARDDTAAVLRKLRAADGFPGVRGELLGVPCSLFDAHAETSVRDAGIPDGAPAPGTVFARRDERLLVRTTDGAIWIGHAKRGDAPGAFKLPAAVALAAEAQGVPAWTGADSAPEIRYEEIVETVGDMNGRHDIAIGLLHFDFYNGAMSTAQCERLLAALEAAKARPTRVMVLLGGADFWSNGLHLNLIEAAASPADASWANIDAIDDVCAAVLTCDDRIVISALQGNAGAGGVFFALAADEVWARESVILNPHYKNMGNLYGSEYWSYVLPRKLGANGAAVMHNRLPLTAHQASEAGLVNRVFAGDVAQFRATVVEQARFAAAHPALLARIAHKAAQRAADEALKPLAAYRAAELAEMRRNFYGFDPSYHVARHHFVHKTPHSWTPRHLALHRAPARHAA